MNMIHLENILKTLRHSKLPKPEPPHDKNIQIHDEGERQYYTWDGQIREGWTDPTGSPADFQLRRHIVYRLTSLGSAPEGYTFVGYNFCAPISEIYQDGKGNTCFFGTCSDMVWQWCPCDGFKATLRAVFLVPIEDWEAIVEMIEYMAKQENINFEEYISLKPEDFY